jgi:hypothetical protein
MLVEAEKAPATEARAGRKNVSHRVDLSALILAAI